MSEEELASQPESESSRKEVKEVKEVREAIDLKEVKEANKEKEVKEEAKEAEAEVKLPRARRRTSKAKALALKQAPGASAKSKVHLCAVGRRKESIARVWLKPGDGSILVNRRTHEEYFARETLRLVIKAPLLVTRQLGKFDVVADVGGGGLAGQAEAIRLGISRVLAAMEPANRSTLRGAGFLTRDSRMRERKKYGRKGARKRFQWTKR